MFDFGILLKPFRWLVALLGRPIAERIARAVSNRVTPVFERELENLVREVEASHTAIQRAAVNKIAWATESGIEPQTRNQSRASLLQQRSSHFDEEKEFIGREIANDIAKRISDKPSQTIILVLDAGSTVLPIFDQICRHPQLRADHVRDRLAIVTNNLAGASRLLHSARNDNLSRVPVRCVLAEGDLDSTYDAILGSQTSLSIERITKSLSQQQHSECIIIGFVTGNYISTVDGILARGAEHLATKRAILSVSHESYLIAPLGKIVPLSAHNLTLALKNTQKRYTGLAIGGDAKRPTLITTTRPKDYSSSWGDLNRYLARLSRTMQSTTFANFDERWSLEFNPLERSKSMQTKRLLLGSDRLPISEYEFPHEDFCALSTRIIEKLVAKRFDQIPEILGLDQH